MTTERSKPLKQVYRVEVEVISPTQAGSGTKLLPDIDYFESNQGIHVVNIESLLSDEKMAAQLFEAKGPFQLAALNRQNSPALMRHVAYTTPGRAKNQEIFAHIRDGFGKPYLPGSSLKGALRTVLAWQFYTATLDTPNAETLKKQLQADLNLNNPDLKNPNNLKRLSERADDRLEARFFVSAELARKEVRRQPNYDLLRTIQVADLYPVETTQAAPLQLEDVQIFVRGQNERLHPKNRPIKAEMLRERTRLAGRLAVDLFTRDRSEMEFGEKGRQVSNLAELGRARAARLISAELDFYEGCERDDTTDNLYNWYNDLYDRLEGLNPDEFLLPLGWSTGWNGKTYGENLRKSQVFDEVRQAFRLGHWEDTSTPFPISRKLIVDGDGTGLLPLGWLLVRLEQQEVR